ncbi:MAG: hypothetical protein WCO56_03490 [Verrucomicrobiota bacterium]
MFADNLEITGGTLGKRESAGGVVINLIKYARFAPRRARFVRCKTQFAVRTKRYAKDKSRVAEAHRGTTPHPACRAEQMHAPTFLEYGGKVGQRGRDTVLDFNPPTMIYRPNSRRPSIPHSEIRIPNLRVPSPLTLTLSLEERE